MQLSFNFGVVALGLSLAKEEGYQRLADICNGSATMKEFHEHIKSLVVTHQVPITEENIKKPF